MRIVRHPNIVELKAFYYSNGERVRFVVTLQLNLLTFHRRTRFILTLYKNLSQRLSTVPLGILTK